MKRAAAPAKKPQKRRKTIVSSDDEADAEPQIKEDAISDEDSEPKKPTRRTKKVVESDDEDDNVPNGAAPIKPSNVKDEGSEDEGERILAWLDEAAFTPGTRHHIEF